MENFNDNAEQEYYYDEQLSLPNADAVLVLGIISIVSCFCYGFFGLIFGVVAIILGSKAKNLYFDNPGLYTESSYKNANAGYICGIIGTIISGIFLIILVFFIVLAGFESLTEIPW